MSRCTVVAYEGQKKHMLTNRSTMLFSHRTVGIAKTMRPWQRMKLSYMKYATRVSLHQIPNFKHLPTCAICSVHANGRIHKGHSMSVSSWEINCYIKLRAAVHVWIQLMSKQIRERDNTESVHPMLKYASYLRGSRGDRQMTETC